ncbi:hypothetical protein FDH01_gp176 [Acinetobacter phage vB_AbaM_ME3]|uniref:Uncharacterized protein n=1 Tax=Acinetobacter phage vB_AbaM_ME3 TaxID=1837876 RepID=A0A172Q0R9_9CAUD|nr:hypothetical protein FDH01_gp176 [Acinetobacter phage vB_AbaM_ME3]AND75446.1 hypothetical protein ME3_285 [Acinetobacter phage vB_AbaM_ME3]
MQIQRVDPYTGKLNTLDLNVTQAQLDSYASGTLIQNAFPHLTPTEREFIKTGLTEESQKEIFGEEDE